MDTMLLFLYFALFSKDKKYRDFCKIYDFKILSTQYYLLLVSSLLRSRVHCTFPCMGLEWHASRPLGFRIIINLQCCTYHTGIITGSYLSCFYYSVSTFWRCLHHGYIIALSVVLSPYESFFIVLTLNKSRWKA